MFLINEDVNKIHLGYLKPEKKIYHLAQKRTRREAHEILFIDDKEENIRAAQEFGWHGIVFDEGNPKQSIEAVRRLLKLHRVED